MWSLWHARNNKLFNNNPISIARIKEEIKSLGFLWIRARSRAPQLTWDDWDSFNLHSLGI
ncbi:hypothetical protein R6Q57_001277 [Mikania cordata]